MLDYQDAIEGLNTRVGLTNEELEKNINMYMTANKSAETRKEALTKLRD